MSDQLLVILLILAIIVIMIGLNFNHNRKQKQRIRNKWGTIPTETRHDNEDSLYQSYEKLKKFLDFDSEVDNITWYDLDFFQVFIQLNHTYSSVGSEALYRRLRLFDHDDKYQKETEKLIQFYAENPKEREEMQFIFARLGKKDNNSVVRYLTEANKKGAISLARYIFQGSLPLIGLILILSEVSGLGFAILFGSIVYNVIYSAMKKTEIDMELMSMSYLIQTLNAAKQLTKFDHPRRDDISSLVKPFRSILRFSFIFRTKDTSELGILLDYLNMLFMLPFIGYHFVFNQIKNNEKEAIELWQILGDLEVGYAILNFRETLDLKSTPVFNEEEDIIADEVYHPLIENPVPNPVNWTKNTLVTGSNASGKSTYVKSIAINCILAQTINTTLAESFSMKRGHVLTSMAVEDDVLRGDSYFVAEIKSLKRVLDKVRTNERCYLFIDEILRGTNTVERIAASSSIIRWIGDYPSLTFVATHDVELTDILNQHCDNVHFKEDVTSEDGIKFDYLLQKGPATSRNALLLLDNMDFPDSIVEDAVEKATHFDATQEWLNFEKG